MHVPHISTLGWTAIAAIVQSVTAIIIVILTWRLVHQTTNYVQTTNRYADITRDTLEINTRQLALNEAQVRRELAPSWHVALLNVEAEDRASLRIFNLSKSAARVLYFLLTIESEPTSTRQFELDLPLPAGESQETRFISQGILETLRPWMDFGGKSWKGVLEVRLIFSLAGSVEPLPLSPPFRFRMEIRNGHIVGVKPKLPYIVIGEL